MAEFNIDKIVQSVKISVDNQLEKALAAIVRNELGETEYIVNAKLIAEAIKEYKKTKTQNRHDDGRGFGYNGSANYE